MNSTPSSLPPPQAVLDRDRLTSATLAPLSALSALTRLELASLTVQAGPAAAAVAAAAAAAVRAAARCGGGVGSGGGGGKAQGGRGRGGKGQGPGTSGVGAVAAAATALLRKQRLAGRQAGAGVFAALPQVCARACVSVGVCAVRPPATTCLAALA